MCTSFARSTLAAVAFAAVTLAPVLPAAAGGLTYTFEATSPEPGTTESETGRVLADGANGRLEWTHARTASHQQGALELWRDGGKEHLIVDGARKTYHDQKRDSPAQGSRSLGATPDPWKGGASVLDIFHIPSLMNGAVEISGIAVDVEPRSAEVVAGKECRAVAVHVSYTGAVVYGKEKLAATVKARLELWLTDALGGVVLPFEHGAVAFSTGYAEVDAAIAPKLAALGGVALKRVVSGSRLFEGSPPSSEYRAFEIQALEGATVPPEKLALPAGLRYEKPRFSGPVMIPPAP